MAASNERLVKATLNFTPTAYYTVATSKKVTATGLLLCNSGTNERTITILYAGTVVMKYVMAAKETFGLSVGTVLNTAENITASQDTGTDVSLFVSGVVEDA